MDYKKLVRVADGAVDYKKQLYKAYWDWKRGKSSNVADWEESTVDWYSKEYPDDDIVEEMEPVRFIDLLCKLRNWESIGDVIGYDSIVRERLFERLSEISGLDYDVFYQAWLDCGE